MKDITQEMDQVIDDLKKKGINPLNQKPPENPQEIIGLGDIIESTLIKFGITQERYKNWFELKECNCTERKKWLNGIFSWHTKKQK